MIKTDIAELLNASLSFCACQECRRILCIIKVKFY